MNLTSIIDIMTRNFYIGIGIMTSLAVLFIMTILDSIIYNSAFGVHFLGRFFRNMFDIYANTEFLFTIVLAMVSVGFISIDYMSTIKLLIINRLIHNQTKLTKALGILVVGNFIILCLFFLFFLFACAVFVSHGYCADWSALGYLVGLITMGGILIALLLLYIPIKLFTTK